MNYVDNFFILCLRTVIINLIITPSFDISSSAFLLTYYFSIKFLFFFHEINKEHVCTKLFHQIINLHQIYVTYITSFPLPPKNETTFTTVAKKSMLSPQSDLGFLALHQRFIILSCNTDCSPLFIQSALHPTNHVVSLDFHRNENETFVLDNYLWPFIKETTCLFLIARFNIFRHVNPHLYESWVFSRKSQNNEDLIQ